MSEVRIVRKNVALLTVRQEFMAEDELKHEPKVDQPLHPFYRETIGGFVEFRFVGGSAYKLAKLHRNLCPPM